MQFTPRGIRGAFVLCTRIQSNRHPPAVIGGHAESPCAKEEVHEKEQYNRYSGGKCADDRAFCRARFL